MLFEIEGAGLHLESRTKFREPPRNERLELRESDSFFESENLMIRSQYKLLNMNE